MTCVCGAELTPGFLACPVCHRLVHAAELTALASKARQAEAAGDLTGALGAWRKAIELLPAGTAQRTTLDGEMRRLGAEIDGRAPRKAGDKGGKTAGALAGTGALAAIGLKAKLLLAGLVKLPTLLSMLFYAGATGGATGRGLGLSLGIVGAIYVHEVGHVAALRRYGIEASAPMFVPGFGAFVRMKQYPTDAHEEARTGLAGPLWGLSASIAALVVGVILQQVASKGAAATALTVASWSASINLFNLVPVWQLDGARGLKALSRRERVIVGVVALLAGLVTRTWMGAGVGAVVLVRAAMGGGDAEGDRGMLKLYAGLVVALPLVAWGANLMK